MTNFTSNVDAQTRWRSALMDNYGTPQLGLVRGSGAQVWDADGNAYLDLVGGIAVNALGHAHPAVTRAIHHQVDTLAHTSNLYINQPAVALAEALLDIAGLTGERKVSFVNSGAEANEMAMKISRLTRRTKIVACATAFHGRTMGSLALTGQQSKKEPFEPVVPGVSHVPFGDISALEAAVDDDTAAVFLEPMLGEAGVRPAPDGYLRAAREITSNAGALLIIDEVQTGMARTGRWFAFQRAEITPDLITLAKGLGGGLPLGAVIGTGRAAELIGPGQHGATFGGNPVCCAAGLAVLRTVHQDNLNEHVSALGNDLLAAIAQLAHPLITEVRGEGLLIGIGLSESVAKPAAAAAQRAGYLVNPVTPDTLRLAPPLILTREQAMDFVAALPGVFEATTKELA